MAVDGYLNFDTKINVKGFKQGIDSIGGSVGKLKEQLTGIASAVGIAFGVRELIAWKNEAKDAWNVQLEAEARLEQVMHNTMNATREQIQAVKDWSSELQKAGVIGDEIQLSGLQEMATYLENADSLKTMNVVLNDMLAQQYGLNATAESAVTISTMLGKVLEGQTSALSRYGYSFTEAQENLLKYGTEEQRVATLAEVVEASVGGMNEALARTPAGRMKQLENTMGDVKEQFGQAAANIEAVFLPVLERLVGTLSRAAEIAVGLSRTIAGIFGIEVDNSASTGSAISESVADQEALTEAVEETERAQEGSLAGFDRLNLITSKSAENAEKSTGSEKKGVSVPPVINESKTEKAANELTEKLQHFLEPVRLAWDANFPELSAALTYAAEGVGELLSSVWDSLETVWTNGSGQRYVGDIISLFSEVFDLIGSISGALDTAWDDGGKGNALIRSWFDRQSALLELIREISGTFRTAWDDGSGAEICGNILGIMTNINEASANIRTSFKNAWAENGTDIWKAVLDLVETFSGRAEHIAGITAAWAANLDFSAFLGAVDGLLEALDPLAEGIGEGLEQFYNNVLLPLGKWTLETAVPTFIDLLTAAVDAVNSAIKAAKPKLKWLWESFLSPLGEFTGAVAIGFLEDMSDLLGDLSSLLSGDTSLGEFTGQLNTMQSAALVLSGAFAGSKLIGGINGLSKAFKALKVPSWISGISGFVTKAVPALLTDVSALVSTGLSGIFGVVASSVGAFFAGWELGTLLKEKILDPIFDFQTAFELGMDSIVDFFSGLLESFILGWETIGVFFTETLPQLFTSAIDGIKAIFSDISGFMLQQFLSAYEGIKEIFAAVGEWFSDRWSDVCDVFAGVKDFFSDTFRAAYNGVKQAFESVGAWFKDKFCGAWNGITDIFSGIGAWSSDRRDDVTKAFYAVDTWFREKFTSARESIKNVFSIENISGFFNSVWSAVKSVFSPVTDWFREKFSAAWEAVKGVFSAGGEIFHGITESIAETFKTVVNALIDGINKVIAVPFNTLNWALDGIRDWWLYTPWGDFYPFDWLPSLSIPEIPHLAQGTVVPANYGEFLAVLGDNKREAEIVAPESRIEEAVTRAMSKIGGNTPKEIVVNTYLYPNSSAYHREIVKIVNGDRVRKGG